MKKNIGFVDTLLRVIFSLMVFMLAVFGMITGITAIVLCLLGAIFLVTSMAGTCVVYLPFGISTRKKSTDH